MSDRRQEFSPIGIVCGGGSLPFAIANAVLRTGRHAVLFPIMGWADRDMAAKYDHRWIRLGQFGRFRKLAAESGCRDIVFIGTLVRPALKDLRLDWTTLRLLPRIAALFRGGDDHLLRGVGKVFEDYGFRLLGADEVAPDVLMPEGPIGRRQPSAREAADIEIGLQLLQAIGPYDIGQAVVVAERRVLAVEAAEGTDSMLARLVDLRRLGRIRTPVGVGVFVKTAKPGQDRRFDLPSIGPQTVAGVARAGLAGMAIGAGEALIAEPQLVAAAADSTKMFVVGVPVPARAKQA